MHSVPGTHHSPAPRHSQLVQPSFVELSGILWRGGPPPGRWTTWCGCACCPPRTPTVGPARCCSPRHRMTFNSRSEGGSTRVSMTRRARSARPYPTGAPPPPWPCRPSTWPAPPATPSPRWRPSWRGPPDIARHVIDTRLEPSFYETSGIL